MATSTTATFNFTLLQGSDKAGYASINTVINSIDNALRYRTASPGMIVIFDTSYSSFPTSGWDNLGVSASGTLPTLSSPYVYARKTTTL